MFIKLVNYYVPKTSRYILKGSRVVHRVIPGRNPSAAKEKNHGDVPYHGWAAVVADMVGACRS
jgi:hypothetical protein